MHYRLPAISQIKMNFISKNQGSGVTPLNPECSSSGCENTFLGHVKVWEKLPVRLKWMEMFWPVRRNPPARIQIPAMGSQELSYGAVEAYLILTNAPRPLPLNAAARQIQTLVPLQFKQLSEIKEKFDALQLTRYQ
jgi:hypothetical protein